MQENLPENETPPYPPVRRPADYYEGDPGSTLPQNSGCRKWAIGCGGAGCLFLLLLAAGFAWLVARGTPMLVGYAFEQIEQEAEQSGSSSPELRRDFHDELSKLRAGIEAKTVAREDLQELLQSAMSVMQDSEVSREELDHLLELMKSANDRAGSTSRRIDD